MTDMDDIIHEISQVLEYVNEIAGGFTLFLHQDASADIGGYLLLATDDPDDIKTDVGPFAITGDDQELEQFATAAGEPGLTTLQHGVYEMHFHAEKTAGTKDAEVYFKIYKRAAGGAETLLGTSEVTSAIGSGESEYSIHTSIIEQILLVDDRIVLKLFGSPTGLGSNPTISVYVEGVTLSRLTIPVGIGDIGGGTILSEVVLHPIFIAAGCVASASGGTFGFIFYPAADQDCYSIWQSKYSKDGDVLTNPTLYVVIGSSTSGDTWGGNLDVTAEGDTEGSKLSTLFNNIFSFTAAAQDTLYYVTQVLSGTISAGDIVSARIQKTSNDTRSMHIYGVFIK